MAAKMSSPPKVTPKDPLRQKGPSGRFWENTKRRYRLTALYIARRVPSFAINEFNDLRQSTLSQSEICFI